MEKNIILNIENTVKEINQVKKLVVDFHKLAAAVSDWEESNNYNLECEYKMDYCKELINNLLDLTAEYGIIEENEQYEFLENNFDFKQFDAATIWDYME